MLGDEQVWLGEKDDEKQEGNLVEHKASPRVWSPVLCWEAGDSIWMQSFSPS